jgi:hypothetical protein
LTVIISKTTCHINVMCSEGFWHVTPHSLEDVTSVPVKCWLTYTKLHDVTSWRTVIVIGTAVRTSYLKDFKFYVIYFLTSCRMHLATLE